jgi:hypothetical protein
VADAFSCPEASTSQDCPVIFSGAASFLFYSSLDKGGGFKRTPIFTDQSLLGPVAGRRRWRRRQLLRTPGSSLFGATTVATQIAQTRATAALQAQLDASSLHHSTPRHP